MPKHQPYYVYMLLCKNKSIYTGITDDIQRRLEQHKTGTGARYTRSFGAVRILYSERVSSRSLALKREYEIKTWSRSKKQELVDSKKR